MEWSDQSYTFLKFLSCLMSFGYTLTTSESFTCLVICKCGIDPLVWIHLLCHSLDNVQQKPYKYQHYKAFPSHCLLAALESRTVNKIVCF